MGSRSGVCAAWYSDRSSGNNDKVTGSLKCMNEMKGQTVTYSKDEGQLPIS